MDASRNYEQPARNVAAGQVGGNLTQIGANYGGVHIHEASRAAVVPRCLPRGPGGLVDRWPVLRRFETLRSGRSPLIVLSGPGGIGKTALALHWLHSVAAEYPDGHLYQDLTDGSTGEPMTPVRVLPEFLRHLGVAPDRIPAEVPEQAALFRSLMADRRMLVLLDNAATAAQVRRLLPASPGSVVVVTSRRRLPGLTADGAHAIVLDPLDDTSSAELLTWLAGDRAAEDPEWLAAMAGYCGGLPLALSIASRGLAGRPRSAYTRALARLADEKRRLAALTAEEDVSVRAVFDVSYRELDPAAARLFRLLGLHPGRSFGTGAVAALAGLDEDESEHLLDVLVQANLVEELDEDRFGLHDLLRVYARERAEEDETAEAVDAAVRRVLDWYLAAAAAADLTLGPGRWRLGPVYDQVRARSGKETAWAWLEPERENLRVAVETAHARGWYEHAWWLCEALWYLYFLRKYYEDWIVTHRLGIEAARQCDDGAAEARMRCQLGFALIGRDRLDEAAQEFEAARQAAVSAGHRQGEATAVESLGLLELRREQNAQAIEALTRNLELVTETGDQRAILLARHHLGRAYGAAGAEERALGLLLPLPEEFAALPDVYNQARALTSLGDLRLRSGHPDLAEPLLTQALGIMRTEQAREQQADILDLLATVAAERDDPEAARARLAEALAIYEKTGSPKADLVRDRLGRS